MSFLGQLIQAFVNAICGPPPPEDKPQQPPPQEWRPVPAHQQQQPVPYYPEQRPSYPPKPHTPHHVQEAPASPPHRPQHQGTDQNLVNQHNEHYVALRARANQAGDEMAKCFEQGHQAYARKDGALAKDMSNQGKDHQRRMEALNRQASDWIFAENNKDSKPGEVDLHGLYVKEAIFHTEKAIQEARRRGDSEIHLIVGKGLHSPGGAAKVKPAIAELMQKEQLVAELDPGNAGVLIVHMAGAEQIQGGGVGADDIAKHLENGDKGCIVM